MHKDLLIQHLNELSKITNSEWLKSLDRRKFEELDFHNKSRDRIKAAAITQDDFEKYYSNNKYYKTVKRSKQFVDEWIKTNSNGKVFLDYACGNGFNAILSAKSNAELAIGIDISDTSIENAKRDAGEIGLNNIYFVQADAENTKLPDNSVDTIICSGMLHHLDLSHAFPELRRILKPNGRILAVEALNYNPLIKAYRHFTPALRTEWEKNHILDFSDLKLASAFFDVRSIQYWHVTAYAGAHMPWAIPVLDGLDKILESIPGIRLMSWIFTFELHSRKEK